MGSPSSSSAGPLPLLKINGSFLTTPAPHAPRLSTSSIFYYDRDILSDHIRTSAKAFKPKSYFIDLKEDNEGKRYMKITEKSNGKKSGIFVNVGDVKTFCEALSKAKGGEGCDMVLSGEDFSMIWNVETNCVQIKKHRNDGKWSNIFIEDTEVDEIVRVMKKFAVSGNKELSTKNPMNV